MLAPGAPAPHFALPDQSGTVQNAKSLKGKRYLVYFYPKDSTPGCTVQACGIQSDLAQFNKLGIPVFGVSMDSVASHRKFADKYALSFPLLADTERGSRMRLESRCQVRVPLIGGQIEQFVMAGLRMLFEKEGEFTAEWITSHR